MKETLHFGRGAAACSRFLGKEMAEAPMFSDGLSRLQIGAPPK